MTKILFMFLFSRASLLVQSINADFFVASDPDHFLELELKKDSSYSYTYR